MVEIEKEGIFLEGTYRLQMDEKGRVYIPKEVFTALQLSGVNRLVLTFWNGVIWCYNPRRWGELRRRFDSGGFPEFDAKLLQCERLLFGLSRVCRVDAQRRLVIPEHLREMAGLQPGGRAVLSVLPTHMEIWSEEKWQQYISAVDEGAWLEVASRLLRRLEGNGEDGAEQE